MKNLLQYNTYYLLGIKGVAMTNIALILQKMGKKINGYDSKDTFITDLVLQKNNISYVTELPIFSQDKLSDVYVYSGAHNGSENPILKDAVNKGKIIVSQAELIEEIRKLFTISVGICGCHGKTTTSSLLAYSLTKLKVKPSYIIGTSTFQDLDGGDYNKNSQYFIFEADEYGLQPPRDMRPKLLMYYPKYIICNNIDFDHPDVYRNINDIKKTFLAFFAQHNLFLCSDDLHIQSLLSKLNRNQYKTFGFSDNSDLQLTIVNSNEFYTTFTASYNKKNLGVFSIPLFGNKNISNTGGVILALLEFGFSIYQIKKVIKNFSSVKRRFEFVYKKNGILLYDDYAHHPAEINATIQAIRMRFKDKRIVIIFQPHTFSRTESLKTPIVQALSNADIAYVSPIFPSAREEAKNFKINSDVLNKEVKLLGLSNVNICNTKKEIIEKLAHQLRLGDIVITMGAGDIYKLKDDIIEVINVNEKQTNNN